MTNFRVLAMLAMLAVRVVTPALWVLLERSTAQEPPAVLAGSREALRALTALTVVREGTPVAAAGQWADRRAALRRGQETLTTRPRANPLGSLRGPTSSGSPALQR